MALRSTYGWCNNGNGADAFGFSVLPAGNRDIYDGKGLYDAEGGYAFFWGSEERNDDEALFMSLNHVDNDVSLLYANKYFGYSVRCVKD